MRHLVMIALACQPICQPIRVDPIRVDLAPPLSQPVQVELAPPLSQPVQVELAPPLSQPVQVELTYTGADSPMARYLWGLIAGGVGLVVLAWARPAYWPFRRGRSPPRTDRGR